MKPVTIADVWHHQDSHLVLLSVKEKRFNEPQWINRAYVLYPWESFWDLWPNERFEHQIKDEETGWYLKNIKCWVLAEKPGSGVLSPLLMSLCADESKLSITPLTKRQEAISLIEPSDLALYIKYITPSGEKYLRGEFK